MAETLNMGGRCERCGTRQERRASPTGGWFTICPTCPVPDPALPSDEYVEKWGMSPSCRYITDEKGGQTPVVEVRQHDFIAGRHAYQLLEALTAAVLEMPGGVLLCALPANEHDAPFASVQGLRFDNPTTAVWLYESDDVDGALRLLRDSRSPGAPGATSEGGGNG